jgi:hypothetical protein
MAKKKKNRSCNDIRGYATTNSQSSALPLPTSIASLSVSNMGTSRLPWKNPVTKQVVKSSSSASALRMQITSDFQYTMESLLCALHSLHEDSAECGQDATTVAATLPPLTALENIRGFNEVDATKLRRRVGTIYDSLVEFGFHFQQIEDAVTACSTNVTLALALDWLCYNIPTSDLPTLFTEGLIRESETKNLNDTEGVTLFPAAPPMVARLVSPPTECILNMSLAEARNQETVKVVNDNEKWSSEQKAILLAQYEFDSISVGDDESLCSDSFYCPLQTNGRSRAADPLAVRKDSVLVENASAAPLLDDINTPEVIDSADVLSNATRTRFEALQCQLHALEDDLRNEANNYMRSKDEIKDLERKANILRKEVAVWDAKLRRHTADENRLLKVEADANSDLDDDHIADLFSVFKEAEDVQKDMPKESCNTHDTLSGLDVGILVPDDSLPSDWTGQTPKSFLEEFCRKEKISKPSFEKLSLNGCRLHIKRKAGNKTFEEPGPHTNYLGVQHYLSMKALYEMTPSLPLYRLFPPFYRDVWINWINKEKQEKLEQSDIRASIRSEKIDTLMECMKLASASCSKTSKVARHGLSEKYALPLSNRFSKFKGPMAENMKDTPTEYGAILQKEFNSRKESHSFKYMESIRSHLPIHCYRELILETIREHPVTILCAETGK